MKTVSRVVLGHYDEEKLQEIHQILKGLELEVFSASNGEEILKQVKDRKPDLVLVDVLMPGVNGFEICRSVKDSMGKRYIAVVLMTVGGFFLMYLMALL